jgi:hypothetical protein
LGQLVVALWGKALQKKIFKKQITLKYSFLLMVRLIQLLMALSLRINWAKTVVKKDNNQKRITGVASFHFAQDIPKKKADFFCSPFLASRKAAIAQSLATRDRILVPLKNQK